MDTVQKTRNDIKNTQRLVSQGPYTGPFHIEEIIVHVVSLKISILMDYEVYLKSYQNNVPFFDNSCSEF